nr:putative NaTx Tcis33 [Tityus cisandinus]
MNCLMLIFVVFLLTFGVECKKDDYPVDTAKRNCMLDCNIIDDEGYCDKFCKGRKADRGYCYSLKAACYCYGLPDDSPTKKPGRCNPNLR